MNRLTVTHGYLTRLARDARYNWLASLKPIRRELARARIDQHRGRSCCRGPRKFLQIPMTVFEQVVQDRRFLSDLRELKRREKYESVIVLVAGMNTSL